MRPARHPLRLGLVLLAWLAQLLLPLAHAAMPVAPAAASGWCGNPAQAQAVLAELPPELRPAADPVGASAQHLDVCAKLCAVAATPPLATVPAPTLALRTARLEPAAPAAPEPAGREPAPRPPSQAPPLHG